MNTCSGCGLQLDKEMRFCRACGAVVNQPPRMVVPLENIGNQSDLATEVFEKDPQDEPRYYLSTPTISSKKPQNGKMIFFVFGALFTVFVLLVSAAGVLVYLYFQSTDRTETVKTAPSQTPKKESPKPSPSPSPTAQETPETVLKPQKNPTRFGSFSVDGKSEKWQISEIETIESERFSTGVRGTSTLHGIGANITAEGIEGNEERRIYSEYPTGALLMRTRLANGKVSVIQAISDSDEWKNDPDESGRIEFLINDNKPENNKGGFIVSVKMLRVP